MKEAEEKHPDVFFVFVVKQGLPKPLKDVVGCGRALEVHGGECGEGVLVQVVLVLVLVGVVLHREVVDVDLLQPPPANILSTDADVR